MYRTLCVLTVLTCMICFTGCGRELSNYEKAERFLELYYTEPDSVIYEVLQVPISERTEEYDDILLDTISAVYGDLVSEEKLNDTTQYFVQSFIMKYLSYSKGITQAQTVKEIQLEELNEKQFSYELIVEEEASGKELFYYGSVQFDEEDKINFISVKSKND